jgi:hypothetical protein
MTHTHTPPVCAQCLAELNDPARRRRQLREDIINYDGRSRFCLSLRRQLLDDPTYSLTAAQIQGWHRAIAYQPVGNGGGGAKKRPSAFEGHAAQGWFTGTGRVQAA